jgi:hypothetical protein
VSKHEPSVIATNDNPALESRRVRTQPFTVAFVPGFALNALATDMLLIERSSQYSGTGVSPVMETKRWDGRLARRWW